MSYTDFLSILDFEMPLQLNLTEESDLTQYNLEHNATITVPSYSNLNKPGYGHQTYCVLCNKYDGTSDQGL